MESKVWNEGKSALKQLDGRLGWWQCHGKLLRVAQESTRSREIDGIVVWRHFKTLGGFECCGQFLCAA